VKAKLALHGVTVTAWARAHKFERMTVVDVLRGHRKGLRGEARRVAIALGLIDGTVADPLSITFGGQK